MNRKLIAIVPAAGVGSRAATAIPKQYQPIQSVPMLRLAVTALLADSRIDQVRVAVAPGDTRVSAALHGLSRTVWRECGGPTRAETVAAALQDAQLNDEDWVLVHDAARPGLPAAALANLITVCLDTGQGGLLALRVSDTVKRERDATTCTTAVVQASVPRDGLWLAQTPQMFPAGVLMHALTEAIRTGYEITDEASAVELMGHTPLLISGSMRNFKVTWPEDVELMAKWL